MGILFRDSRTVRYVAIGKRTIKDGEAAAVFNERGEHRQIVGPRLVRLWCSTIRFLDRLVAGPTEYLCVTHKNGRIEHVRGPVAMFSNPVLHQSIVLKKATVLASPNECLVVYTQKKPKVFQGSVLSGNSQVNGHVVKHSNSESKEADQASKHGETAGKIELVAAPAISAGDEDEVIRRVVTGPAMFVPAVNEWTHKFDWTSQSSLQALKKARKSFEVLPTGIRRLDMSVLLRTSDSIKMTAKISLQYGIEDVVEVLTCDDPIAAMHSLIAADLSEFGTLLRSDALLSPEARNRVTIQLGDVGTYKKLVDGASGMGIRIAGLCLRSLDASKELQQQYDQAIGVKAQLTAERAVAEQQQKMVDLKLANQKRRIESEQAIASAEAAHMLRLQAEEQKQKFEHEQEAHTHRLRMEDESKKQQFEHDREANLEVISFLKELKESGVDLTQYLTSFSGQQATAGTLQKARPLRYLSPPNAALETL